MAVEITCNCGQMAYRRITKDSAGQDVPGPEVAITQDQVLKIEELQTIELIDKGDGAHVLMRNVGTADVQYEYVGQVKMTLAAGSKAYVDRAFKIRFFDGLPEKAVVSDTEVSGVQKVPVESAASASALAASSIEGQIYTTQNPYLTK